MNRGVYVEVSIECPLKPQSCENCKTLGHSVHVYPRKNEKEWVPKGSFKLEKQKIQKVCNAIGPTSPLKVNVSYSNNTSPV